MSMYNNYIVLVSLCFQLISLKEELSRMEADHVRMGERNTLLEQRWSRKSKDLEATHHQLEAEMHRQTKLLRETRGRNNDLEQEMDSMKEFIVAW